MRHLRFAAVAAALVLGACYGAPEDLPGGTTTGSPSPTGTATSTTSTTTGGAGASTGAGNTTGANSTGVSGSGCATPCHSAADCPSQSGQTGPAVCLSNGLCEYTLVVAGGSITENLCPSAQGTTTDGSGSTTGTSTTGTTGSCGCQSDADCVALYGSGATCSNGACWINGPDNGAIGGTTGCGSSTTTSSTTGTTGTTGSCGCQSDADCAQYGSGAYCQNGGCYITGPGSGTLTGTTGCGSSTTTSSTTGTTGTTGSCGCQSDADCAQYGSGAYCQNGACYVSGPNGGTIGTTGCGGSSSTTTGSTTGSGCLNPCNTVSDCPTFADATLLACNGGLCDYSFTCSSTGGGGAAVCPGTDPGGCGGSTTSSTTGGSSTPLVLSFDRAPVHFTEAGGRFELGQGGARTTDWVDARTPWLALDRNGNGRIDSGEELFGSLTRLPDGTRAANGFQALRALDANHDGRLDSKDPGFARLVLWRDADQDRQSRPAELVSLARAGVVAIELGYTASDRCDARGNCERERAAFLYRGAHGELRRGEVVDVHLAHRPALLSVR